MASAALVRRARLRFPHGRVDSSRRRHPPLEDEPAVARVDMASALPDDMLLEVFKRLPLPTAAFCCAAVCRRWRRAVSHAGDLPAPSRHFGFFRNYGPSALPPFVPTAGVALGLGFLLVSPACGAILIDSRGHWLKKEAKKAQATATAEEEERRMEREARGKMEEDRKMAEEMKRPKEVEGIMGETMAGFGNGRGLAAASQKY